MTDLFNPETCMLMSAKDIQKKLDDQNQIWISPVS